MAFTYAGQYTEVILGTSSAGFAVALPSLSTHVYLVGTTTHPTLYTSRTKGTTTANPTTTDVNGNLTFFVDPGQYDIVFTPPGGSQKRVTVNVPVDPAELSAAYPTVVNVAGYGATGDGTTDDTAAIQAAITAVASGGLVYIPVGLYKITSPLSITKHVTIRGGGVSANFQPLATSSSFDYPTTSPYLSGTVLLQSTAATNGIEITKAGAQVNLSDFGIRFADAIKFSNTGHGVYAVPSTTSGGGHDHGALNGVWDNVQVFGHDGNHYAFYSINAMYGTTRNLRSYGGGMMHIQCDSTAGNYGNAVHVHPYGALIVAGSAHGYNLVAASTSTPGAAPFISFKRPQVNADDASSYFPGVAKPTAAQNLFRSVNVGNLDIDCSDFEDGTGNSLTTAIGDNGNVRNVAMGPNGTAARDMTPARVRESIWLAPKIFEIGDGVPTWGGADDAMTQYVALHKAQIDSVTTTIRVPTGITNLDLVAYWWPTDSTAGNVVFRVVYKRFANGDLESKATTVGASSVIASPGTAKTIAGSTVQTGMTVVAGEFFSFKLQRLSSNGSDTYAGDARLLGIKINPS